ncbi:Uncharacterized protein TCM_026429 [Theobroma cacao]|uniref:Uncharacterized protein n=1 Tax=Theobroma cacao TaxID=3641 RepID=A0A061F2C7_THECC|nr:Uncharacterized protein TCM_026429 [Theobroma cacao]
MPTTYTSTKLFFNVSLKFTIFLKLLKLLTTWLLFLVSSAAPSPSSAASFLVAVRLLLPPNVNTIVLKVPLLKRALHLLEQWHSLQESVS